MTPVHTTLTALALLDLVASLLVLFNRSYTGRQRVLQLAIIWLLPLVGALICIGIAWSDRASLTVRSTFDPLHKPTDGSTIDATGLPGTHLRHGDNDH